MKILMTVFLFVAILSATFGSMQGISPEVVLSTKITLVASILLFLVTLVTNYVKSDNHHHHGHRHGNAH